jgi:hypothetical protein
MVECVQQRRRWLCDVVLNRSVRQSRAVARRLCFVFAVLAGCASKTPPSTTPPCNSPPPGIGPDAGATLQNADDGTTVCLSKGEVLTVYLRVPLGQASTRKWSAVTETGDALDARSNGVQTLVRGVTGAIFVGATRGVAVLSSTLHCPPGCAPKTWRATVVVR